MPKSQVLSHVAMSVPAGTLTDEYRSRVLEFYGRVFGWHEIESLRLPDRLTIAVGANYINVRERDDAATYTGYEHFGVSFPTAEELRERGSAPTGTTPTRRWNQSRSPPTVSPRSGCGTCSR